MQTKRPWLHLSIGLAAASAATAISAAGLGQGGASAVLGQPLDFAIPVRLDAGERLTPDCVSAEVTSGDRRVPPALVRTLVEMTGPDTARVRVTTQSAMDEPVIGIQLTLGCSLRIARRYVVLADPPANNPAAPPAFAATPVAVPEAATPPATPAVATNDGAAPARTPAPSTAAAPRVAPRPLTPEELQAREQRRAERRAARAARAEAARQRQLAVAGAPAAEGPRLKLESAEIAAAPAPSLAVAEALAAVAQAASAARAAASAASASAERIASLERTVEQLRADAKTSRDLAAQFRQRLAEAEGASSWVMPLMAIAALLAALAAWLAWRLGRVQAERQQIWREAATPVPGPVSMQEATPSRQPTAPIPFVTSELKPPAPQTIGRRNAPAWPPPAPAVAWPPPASTLPPEVADTEVGIGPEPTIERTQPMPPHMKPEEGAPRDVSIEELIDLEQQAEFFVVLGQDEAAIDLLVEHLRSTGGGSPLPYLKLLEIHHRRNDRDAYERMRTRFNQRFNAYAPEWGVDLGHGRSLEDYTGVIPRLQQVWPRPLDAMAELEALLFRKSRGELFDLPAYREVLFLYSLARDLLDRAAADNGDVDLLLPMPDGTAVGTTVTVPYAGLERDAFKDTQVPDDLPTGPVDFDVSVAERRTSIFDLLDEPTQPVTPRRS